MEFYRDKFIDLRRKNRWSINSLSEAIQVSRQSISQWENGKRIPTEKRIREMAKVLNIPVSEISDLESYRQVSEIKIEDSIPFTNLLGLSSGQSQQKDITKIAINAVGNMVSEYQNMAITLNAILFNTQDIVYLKSPDSKYILANQKFLDVLGLNPGFNVRGKSDYDLLTLSEAKINLEQDNEVINSGKPILQKEQLIIGSRKKRWGIISKIPVFDSNSKIMAVLGVIVDISERITNEKYRKILEYAITQSKTTIWVGRGINLNESIVSYSELLYLKLGSKDNFWGDKDTSFIAPKEWESLWYPLIPQKLKDRFIQEKKKSIYPNTRYYYMNSPYTGKMVWIREIIYFDKENETFIGFISEDSDNFKLKLLMKIMNSMPNIIIWSAYKSSDDVSHYSYVSNTLPLTGYESSSFTDGSITMMDLAIDDHKVLFEELYKVIQFPISFEFKILRKDGKERWLRGNFFKDSSNDLYESEEYFGYYTDISEDKYMQELIKDANFS